MTRIRQLASLALCTAALAACTGSTVYSSYEHTPLAGWEKSDFLTFGVGRVEEPGRYAMDLGLRTGSTYPFVNLTLIVDTHLFPAGSVTTDTLQLQLSDESGESLGQGINLQQYKFRIREMTLAAGDSLVVNVRHDMKREILPGISDVGIEVNAGQ